MGRSGARGTDRGCPCVPVSICVYLCSSVVPSPILTRGRLGGFLLHLSSIGDHLDRDIIQVANFAVMTEDNLAEDATCIEVVVGPCLEVDADGTLDARLEAVDLKAAVGVGGERRIVGPDTVGTIG